MGANPRPALRETPYGSTHKRADKRNLSDRPCGALTLRSPLPGGRRRRGPSERGAWLSVGVRCRRQRRGARQARGSHWQSQQTSGRHRKLAHSSELRTRSAEPPPRVKHLPRRRRSKTIATGRVERVIRRCKAATYSAHSTRPASRLRSLRELRRGQPAFAFSVEKTSHDDARLHGSPPGCASAQSGSQERRSLCSWAPELACGSSGDWSVSAAPRLRLGSSAAHRAKRPAHLPGHQRRQNPRRGRNARERRNDRVAQPGDRGAV